jgi:hypothetical protein
MGEGSGRSVLHGTLSNRVVFGIWIFNHLLDFGLRQALAGLEVLARE